MERFELSRRGAPDLPHFECGPFNHLGTSPKNILFGYIKINRKLSISPTHEQNKDTVIRYFIIIFYIGDNDEIPYDYSTFYFIRGISHCQVLNWNTVDTVL